jgi:hypothetical protein
MTKEKSGPIIITHLVRITILFLLLTSCQEQPVQVSLVEPSITQMETQKVELRNCESKAEMRKNLSEVVTIDQEITISPTATSIETGDKLEISTQLRQQLEAEVNQAYHQLTKQARQELEKAELIVPVGKIRTFEVAWEKHLYSSKLSFSQDNNRYSADYTYLICIPQVLGYVEMSCTA